MVKTLEIVNEDYQSVLYTEDTLIPKTLPNTKKATFSISLPSHGNPRVFAPIGTGFFVSKTGVFLTAAHVITQDNLPNGVPRSDLSSAWLRKETKEIADSPIICDTISLLKQFPDLDIAVLQVDFQANKNKDWLNNANGFPFISPSHSMLEDGTPVYAFGYPLSSASIIQNSPQVVVSTQALCPRTTSCIVSSSIEKTKMFTSASDARVFVLDKALNYGNSGGPIVCTSTGRVHGLCSHFQPVQYTQTQVGLPPIMVASNYGIVTSLANRDIVNFLTQLGVIFK